MLIDLRSVRDVVREFIVEPLLDLVVERCVQIDELGRLDEDRQSSVTVRT